MDYKEAASLLASEAIGAGLRVECEFVPLSRSRNAREKHPTVNWRVRLFRADDGREKERRWTRISVWPSLF